MRGKIQKNLRVRIEPDFASCVGSGHEVCNAKGQIQPRVRLDEKFQEQPDDKAEPDSTISIKLHGQRVTPAKGQATAKNTICLWYDKDAEAAARFYAETFPNSVVSAVHRAPSDYPSGKKGDVLTVEFTVAGVPCIGLNGGPAFKHNEAFSFQIATDDQQETDRYWNAVVGNGGQESACGWCKDKWGVSWQITPRVLTEAMAAGGDEAKRAFDATMSMKKIDVAAIKAARRG
jgi:predicted 3-demethylubiquinone-9 3-methyltransferase (glyoxalase superfamily)